MGEGRRVDTEAVIDEIYEAAVVPGAWLRVLDRVAEIAGAEGTMLFANGAERSHCICSKAIEPLVTGWLTGPWLGKAQRGLRLIPIREPRFLTDLDAFTHEELDADPYQTEYLRPQGFGWCVGTTIRSPVGDLLVFSAERKLDKGPVEREAIDRLDGLRPHLARAAILSARIGLERARATVDALQAIGLPAAVLTASGRVVVANPGFEAGETGVSAGAGDRVGFSHPAAQAIFAETLSMAGREAAPQVGRSIAVPGDGESPPLVAHLIPLRGDARDIFSGASSLLYLTPLASARAPDLKLLELLFDLTPAEARIASLLVEGRAVGEIAVAQRVTQNAVRMHLKAIFAKTGVSRQAQLVSLLTMPARGASQVRG